MDGKVTAWCSSIETGFPEIDAQHKALFDLAASFRNHGDEIRIMKSLAILCDYAKIHLNDEEALLEKIGYSDLEAHRKAHAEFRRLLGELLADARRIGLEQIAVRVEQLINHWFLNHILHVDMLYIPMVMAYESYQQQLRLQCLNSTSASSTEPDQA